MGCAGPSTTCNFGDIGISSLGIEGEWLLAGVNVSGCADGQLRIGYLINATGEFIVRGPAARSNIYLGVDIEDAWGLDGRVVGLKPG